MSIETHSEKNMGISRSDFGPGKAGDRAWSMISEGAQCGAFIDGDTSSECGKNAIGTTDVDILADLTQIPHCSLLCHQKIVDRVEADLALAGRSMVPGRNGFGRA
jgi:hypothetical protein